MKKFIVPVLLLIIVLFAGCADEKHIKIGALLCTSGDLSSFGTAAKAACEIAEKDINSYLGCIGNPYSFHIEFYDTQTDPIVGLRKAKLLHSKGIKTIIGVQASSELAYIKPFADDNDLVIISTESTSPDLAIEHDHIFRLVPDDHNQAVATNQLMRNCQYKAILPFWRDDAWGKGLTDAMKEICSSTGITFLQGVAFDPLSHDIDAYLFQLDALAKEYSNTFARDELCIYFLAFDETTLILEALSHYPDLMDLRWFGSDGSAKIGGILSNDTAAETVVKIELLCPMYSPERTEKARFLELQLQNKYHVNPTSYCSTAYDACWLAALSLILTKNGNSDEVAKAFVHTADSHYGSSGWTELNDAGDREFGNFDFWKLDKNNDSYLWKSDLSFNGENHKLFKK